MFEAGVLLEGEYQVWGRVGGGGMSDVWLARHVEMAMPLIIKTLKPSVGTRYADRYERLIREARLMARVRSHRVVRALDVGVFGDVPYLIQEYVDGIDLEELDMRRRSALHRGLPLWFVCETLAEAASGLHAAHQTGVLHRDVKPSNLFFSPEEGIKLGDFGIARGRDQQGPQDISGTVLFMAPETLRGESIDRRSDIYGLGATGFTLRYGYPPFDDPMAALSGPMTPRFPPAETPEEAYFQQVIARAMAYARDARYHDLTEPRRLLHSLAVSLRRPLRSLLQPDGSILAGSTRLCFEVGDIAAARGDGIVCASNSQLSMDTGVAGALKRAGGDEIEREAQAGGERPLGDCVVTGPGKLSCRLLLHAVSAWREASCIARATQRALLIAEERGLETLVMPALGSGAAGVALEASASSIAAALKVHLELGGSRLREVRFVLFDEQKLCDFREVLDSLFLGSSDERPTDLGMPSSMQISQAAVSVEQPTMFAPR